MRGRASGGVDDPSGRIDITWPPPRDGCVSRAAVLCDGMWALAGGITTCPSTGWSLGLPVGGIVWPGIECSLPADGAEKTVGQACFFVATQVYFGQFQGCLPHGGYFLCETSQQVFRTDHTASERRETSRGKKKEKTLESGNKGMARRRRRSRPGPPGPCSRPRARDGMML